MKRGAGSDEPRAAAVPGGPGPEGDQLSGRLDHEGSRKDRVVREVLGIHPVLAPQLDLAMNAGSLQGGHPSDLAHLPHGQERAVEIQQVGSGGNSGSQRHMGCPGGEGKSNNASARPVAGHIAGRWAPLSEMSGSGREFRYLVST